MHTQKVKSCGQHNEECAINLEEKNYKIASYREKVLPHFEVPFSKIGNKNTANIIIELGTFT